MVVVFIMSSPVHVFQVQDGGRLERGWKVAFERTKWWLCPRMLQKIQGKTPRIIIFSQKSLNWERSWEHISRDWKLNEAASMLGTLCGRWEEKLRDQSGNPINWLCISGGGGWGAGIGFAVWAFFLDRFLGYCAKRLRFFGFGVHCGLRMFRFFSISFSVFVQNTSGLSVLVSDFVFGFSYFVLFGFRFLFDLRGNQSRIPAKSQSYWEECVTN